MAFAHITKPCCHDLLRMSLFACVRSQMALPKTASMMSAALSCPARPRALPDIARGRPCEVRRQRRLAALPRAQASTTLVEVPEAPASEIADLADAARRRLLEASFDADAAEEPATLFSNVVAHRPSASAEVCSSVHLLIADPHCLPPGFPAQLRHG